MSGIVFFKTKSLEKMHAFYHDKLKLALWLKQIGCNIYQSGNLLLGFIEAFEPETQGIIDLFFPDQQTIDKKYFLFKDLAVHEPKMNDLYNIYNFPIKDPEGRIVNLQAFAHHLPPFKSLAESLIYRRSYREYKKEPVPTNILNEIFSLCRYSPTASDSQCFYYIATQNNDDLKFLAHSRGDLSEHIVNAPVAVLTVADQTKTLRPSTDAHIAGVYLMMAAFAFGLGSCWVADMNAPDIKERFKIPQNDFLACAIILGYVEENQTIPNKRNINEFVIYRS